MASELPRFRVELRYRLKNGGVWLTQTVHAADAGAAYLYVWKKDVKPYKARQDPWMQVRPAEPATPTEPQP